jgi:hypothetical protein
LVRGLDRKRPRKVLKTCRFLNIFLKKSSKHAGFLTFFVIAGRNRLLCDRTDQLLCARCGLGERPYFHQMPPDAFRCLQMPPDASRCLQMPPDASRRLQMPPDACRRLQMPPDASRCLQTPPDASRRLQTPPDASRRPQMSPDASRGLRVPPVALRCLVPPERPVDLRGNSRSIVIYVFPHCPMDPSGGTPTP